MCHVALEASGFPPRARHRHGRRARLGALPHLHRGRSWASASRRRTRSCWAATATRWCRCRATRRSAACRITGADDAGADRGARRPHAQRRRRGRGAAQDRQRLLRAGRVGGPDGRRDPQRPQARSCPARRTCRASTASTGLFVGVPVKLGRTGIEQIVEIELTDDERAAFDRSALQCASWSTPWTRWRRRQRAAAAQPAAELDSALVPVITISRQFGARRRAGRQRAGRSASAPSSWIAASWRRSPSEPAFREAEARGLRRAAAQLLAARDAALAPSSGEPAMSRRWPYGRARLRPVRCRSGWPR